MLSPDLVTFFHDDNGQSTAGYVKRIHMWDEAKKEADVATICGCTLAEVRVPVLMGLGGVLLLWNVILGFYGAVFLQYWIDLVTGLRLSRTD